MLTYYSNGTTVQLPLNQALDEVNGTTVNIAVRWNMETDFANDTAEITYGVNGGIQTTVMYSNPTAQHDISSIDRGFVRYDLVRAELFARGAGDPDVFCMDGIERPAENGDLHAEALSAGRLPLLLPFSNSITQVARARKV